MRFVIDFGEQFNPWRRRGANVFPLEVPGVSLGALGVKPHSPLSLVFLVQVPVCSAGTRRKSPSVPRDRQVHGHHHDG